MHTDQFQGRNTLTRVVFFLLSYLLISFPAHAQLSARLADGSELEMLGIGVHQELRNDIYIGTLFAPASVKDVEVLKDDQVAKRMSIRLLSGYSQRKMARHWKERLALNNPRKIWQPFTREIIAFSRLFKRKFETGDELNIDFIPGQGTQIYLNGTLFQTFKKPEFTNLLLNVWLGNTPPTRAFKNSIRGQVEQSLKNTLADRYSALQSVAGRFDDDLAGEAENTKVAAVQTQTGPIAAVTSNKPKTVNSSKKASKKSAKKQTNTKIAAKNDEAKGRAEKIASKSNSSPTKSTPAANTSADNSKTLAKTEKPVIKREPAALAKIDIASTKPDIKIDPELEKKAPVEDDLFDVDLISGSYTRDLIDSIRQYQKYPKKALINEEQGDVRVTVSIDTHGEIIDVKLVEKSGSRILDKAVIRMVRKAAPFQAIPKELKLDIFEFDLPISFQL